MKQTQEQIDLITDWFNNTWWPLYPSDLAHGKKGPKTVALKAMLKLNPSEDMMQDILNKMRVLIRAAKSEKRVGKDPDRWPFASTFINQERWTAIEDMAMPSTIVDKRTCECGKPVDIADKCWGCYGEKDKATKDHMQYLYDNLCKQGLDIRSFASRDDWIAACKERAIPRLARLRAKRDMGEVHGS